MSGVGSLQEQALKRREKLKALRNRKREGGGEDDGPLEKLQAEDGDDSLPKPVFRSYKPQDDSLKENTLESAEPVKVEDHVKEQLEAAKPQPVVEQVDLVNLAPRKPDWDLKRDVAKKLEKLDRRTQRAIAELIRERLKAGKEDLAAAVNAAPTQGDSDEEDG